MNNKQVQVDTSEDQGTNSIKMWNYGICIAMILAVAAFLLLKHYKHEKEDLYW